MDQPICCLEIASSGIKLLIGYVFNDSVYVLHALESTRARLNKSGIENKDDMTIAIKELIASASTTLNYKIKDVVLCLPSTGMLIYQSKGETNTTESKASLFDASNCITLIKKSVSKIIKPNMRILDVVPYQYVLDGGVTFDRLPANKKTNQISMLADVETMDGAIIKNFESVVRNADLNILKNVNSANATIKYISSFNSSNPEFVYIDMGARITTFGLGYSSRLNNVVTINFGSDDISEAIAKKFNISFEKAENYKMIFGINKVPPFQLKTADNFTFSELNNVIIESLGKLISELNNFISIVDPNAKNLFILSGGGADLYGLDSYLKRTYNNRVLTFTPTAFGVRNKSYTNCISALKYFNDYEIKTNINRPNDLTLTRIGGISENSEEIKDENIDENSDERL